MQFSYQSITVSLILVCICENEMHKKQKNPFCRNLIENIYTLRQPRYPSTDIHDTSLSLLDIGTSMKSDGVKLVSICFRGWAKTQQKFFTNNIQIIFYLYKMYFFSHNNHHYFSVLISLCTSDYLDDSSFGMVDNPSWWKRADSDEDNVLTDPDQDQFNIDRRSFSRFLSKHKSVIPYYLHRDGVNYGGRPGGGSSRPWNNRPYGLSRLTPRFGLMPIRTRSGPFGINK